MVEEIFYGPVRIVIYVDVIELNEADKGMKTWEQVFKKIHREDLFEELSKFPAR